MLSFLYVFFFLSYTLSPHFLFSSQFSEFPVLERCFIKHRLCCASSGIDLKVCYSAKTGKKTKLDEISFCTITMQHLSIALVDMQTLWPTTLNFYGSIWRMKGPITVSDCDIADKWLSLSRLFTLNSLIHQRKRSQTKWKSLIVNGLFTLNSLIHQRKRSQTKWKSLIVNGPQFFFFC